MKKTLTACICALLILTVAFSFGGCKTEGKVRLSEVTHSIFYAPQYLALALGYFEEVGIELDITNAGGADNVMTALVSGEADIGLCGCEQAIYVVNQGMENHPVVVGQLTKRDGSFLVGRTKIDNFDWSGMQNATVLMGRRGGMPAMILQYVLNNKGYTAQTIDMDYSLQFNMLAPAFTGGTGDYVPLFEPVASQLVSEGKGYILDAIGRVSGEIPYTVYMLKKDYLKDNRQLVENFLTAIKRATDYLFEHTDKECAELLAPYFSGTDVNLIESALKNYKQYDVWMRTPAMQKTSFERLQDIMQNAGELEKRADYNEVSDNSVANEVK